LQHQGCRTAAHGISTWKIALLVRGCHTSKNETLMKNEKVWSEKRSQEESFPMKIVLHPFVSCGENNQNGKSDQCKVVKTCTQKRLAHSLLLKEKKKTSQSSKERPSAI